MIDKEQGPENFEMIQHNNYGFKYINNRVSMVGEFIFQVFSSEIRTVNGPQGLGHEHTFENEFSDYRHPVIDVIVVVC